MTGDRRGGQGRHAFLGACLSASFIKLANNGASNTSVLGLVGAATTARRAVPAVEHDQPGRLPVPAMSETEREVRGGRGADAIPAAFDLNVI